MRVAEREEWLPIALTAAVLAGVSGAIIFALGRFTVGAVLLGASVVLLRWPRSVWTGREEGPLAPARLGLGLALVVGLAAFFRFYRIDPPGLWGDDALNGLIAFNVLDGHVRSPFEIVTHSYSRFHALSNYAIAASFRLFGADLWTLRLPGIVANLACVPLLYATAAPLFGARVALVAALFFATSPFQISHAKGLVQNVLGATFQLAGLCLLVRGMTGRRRWLAVAAGVPLALCIYTYHSAKLAPLVALPYFVAAALEKPPPRRSVWVTGALALAVLALCLVPAYLSYAHVPGALGGRIQGTSLLPIVREQGWRPLWESLWRSLLVFHYQQGPLRYHWFGLGFDPGLDCVVAFLALHGLIEALRRPLRSANLLVLGWLAIGLVPAVLSTEAPRGYRALLASPPLYVLAALPVARLFAPRTGAPWVRRYVATVATLLVAAVPLIDFNYYFYRLYTHPLFHHLQGERLVAMAKELRERGPDWTGFLLADTFDTRHETIRFLSHAWGLHIRNVSSLSEVLPVQEAVGSALFMMTRGTMAALPALAGWYRGAETEVRLEPEARDWWLGTRLPFSAPPRGRAPAVAFVAVEDVDAQAPHGVVATSLSPRGTVIGREILARAELRAAMDLPRTVRLSATLAAPRTGYYRFAVSGGSPARLSIDDAPVIEDGDVSASIPLARGPHLLSADLTVAPGADLRLLWQPPNETIAPIPERQLFTLTHGLLVERRWRGRSERLLDPYPYYVSFAPSPRPDEAITWTGRLRVPGPRTRRLRIDASGAIDLTLDGTPVEPLTKLRPGTHDLEIRLTAPAPPTRLTIWWQAPQAPWEEVPWEAFTPDGTEAGG